MDDTTSENSDVTAIDVQHEHYTDAPPPSAIFPFLRLPRELRDSVITRHYPHFYHLAGTNLI
jgi:hypothetical protein